MTALKFLFWFLLFVVFYAYVGYGILLYLLIMIKRLAGFSKKALPGSSFTMGYLWYDLHGLHHPPRFASLPTPAQRRT